VTKEEVEKMLYAMVLSNYDKIVINENEMDKILIFKS
jgi:helix-turn-helix protein